MAWGRSPAESARARANVSTESNAATPLRSASSTARAIKIERPSRAPREHQAAREPRDGAGVVGRVTKRAFEERHRLRVVPMGQKVRCAEPPNLVSRVGAMHRGLEVFRVGEGPFGVGQLEPQVQAGPTRSFERGESRDRLIEQRQLFADRFRLVRRREERESRQRSVKFAFRRLPQR